MGRIVYITVNAPFGAQETFIITELLALKRLGAEISIAPRDRKEGVFNNNAGPLVKDALRYPLFSAEIALKAAVRAIKNPVAAFHIIKDIVLCSGGVKKALKNLTAAPKAFFLAGIFEGMGVTHMHAHWATTTSTMAYIISRLTGIPWSMTCHRGDIQENNLLSLKCQSASFVRAIDGPGRDEITALAGNKGSVEKKLFVLHMGVDLPELNATAPLNPNTFTFICPANLVEKKGHRYLIEACKILSDGNINYRCIMAGDGPLEDELKKIVFSLNLSERIEFAGRLPNERLLAMYLEKEVSAVVLPSINTKDAQREGIPVALMEAMAYGIPVISTATGGIPELIGDGSGIMIKEKDADAIAGAVIRLSSDRSFYKRLAEKGRKKIALEFNGKKTAERLVKLFNSTQAARHKKIRASDKTRGKGAAGLNIK